MEHFDRFAERYSEILNENVRITGEDSAYFAVYKARYIARQVGSSFAESILDYGCGVGALSRALKRLLPHARVDGFDPSRSSIEKVEPSLRAQGVFTWDRGRLGKEYALIVLANVLHHIRPENRQETIRDLRRRMGPRARLVIVEHNPINPLTRWAVAHCPFDEDAVLLRPGESVEYLQRAGLDSARVDYIVFFPHPLRWLRRLEPQLRWCPLGAQYAVIARDTGAVQVDAGEHASVKVGHGSASSRGSDGRAKTHGHVGAAGAGA